MFAIICQGPQIKIMIKYDITIRWLRSKREKGEESDNSNCWQGWRVPGAPGHCKQDGLL